MLPEFFKANDVVNKAQAAFEREDYVTAVEESNRAIRLARWTYTSENGFCLKTALQLIKSTLEHVSAKVKLSDDELRLILTSCKMAVRNFEELNANGSYLQLDDLLILHDDIESHIENMDSLWKEERTLLKEFQQLDNSKEERSCILAKLAELNSTNISDKVYLLKSSLFLQASLANTNGSSSKTLQQLQTLHRKILRLSGAKWKDLYHASQAIRKNFDETQQRIETSLTNEAKDFKSDVQYDKAAFEKYASMMKTSVSTMADGYVDVFKRASRECIDILGDPPCKFSHFAIGAYGTDDFYGIQGLASAIVLENSEKKKDNFAKSLEYFGWYAVIFQILTCYDGPNWHIRRSAMQHTMTKTSIGKHTSSADNHRRANTTCCVSDAGKLLKLNIDMELIGTVNDLSKSFSQLNSTVSFGEIIELSRTRHIAGNESIHKKLRKRIRKVIYSNELEGDRFQQVVLHQFSKAQFNAFTFHRSLTSKSEIEASEFHNTATFVFDSVNTLGHLAHIEKNSAFAIVQNLQSKGFIDDKAKRSLYAALAISSEMLMSQAASLSCADCDGKKRSTNGNTKKEKLIKLLFVVSALHKVVNTLLNANGTIAVIKGMPVEIEDSSERAEILCHFKWYEDALDMLECQSNSHQKHTSLAFKNFMQGLCLTKLNRLEDANRFLEKGLAILASLPEADQCKIFHFIQYLLGINCLKENKYLKAKDHLGQAKKSFQSKNEQIAHCGEDELYFEILDGLAESQYHLQDYASASAESADLLAQYDSMSFARNDIIFNTVTRQAECLIKLGNYIGCVEVLENALERISSDEFRCEQSDTYSRKIGWQIQLADCHFRLNHVEAAESRCKDVIEAIEAANIDAPGIIAQVKLISAQCHLWQSRHTLASEDACDAIVRSLQAREDQCNILYTVQTAVTVISRCISPMVTFQINIDKDKSGVASGGQALDQATKAYIALCEQSTFQGTQLQRDKSVLFRVIQTGLFKTNKYERVLDVIKSSVDILGTQKPDEVLISRNILQIIEDDEHLRDACVRDCEYLCKAAQFCNIRDAFSISGSVIVFVGCLYKCGIEQELQMAQPMRDWLSSQDTVTNASVLHSIVKIAKYLVEQFLNKVKSSAIPKQNNCQRLPILVFLADMFATLKLQHDSTSDLLQETALLKADAATCWMKVHDYEVALSLLNDALEMQELLALDIASIVYIDSNAIIQNIGLCLAKLDRWQEADSYLNRGSAIKERRRKSRAYEDYSMIHARVKSARCSFSLGNYQEAVFMASTAFLDGLLMDSIDNHDDSMVSAVGIVLKSTLAVSAHAEVNANKASIKTDTITEVLKRAMTMRATLEENPGLLGGVYAETVESFYYACGNCLLVLAQYKQAIKSFRKSLKIMKQKNIHFLGMKQPIILNIAKSLIGQSKFKKAEKYIHQFLDMAQNNSQSTLHNHPSHAYLLLSICSLRRNLCESSFRYACKSLNEAMDSESNVLIQQITKECTNVFLRLLDVAQSFLDLD